MSFCIPPSLLPDYRGLVVRELQVLATWASGLKTNVFCPRPVLYETVSHVLETAGRQALEVMPSATDVDRLWFAVGASIVYHHDLSLSENIVCQWVNRWLDIFSFLHWRNPGSTELQALISRCVIDCWAGLMPPPLPPSDMMGYLKLSNKDMSKAHAVSRQLRKDMLGRRDRTWIRTSAPLWTHFIVAYLHVKAFGLRIPLAFEQTALWFLQSGVSISDHVHLTTIASYVGTPSSLIEVDVLPYTDYDQNDVSTLLVDEALFVAFEIFLPPCALLDQATMEQAGYGRDFSMTSRHTYMATCSLPGSARRYTMSSDQSASLCNAALKAGPDYDEVDDDGSASDQFKHRGREGEFTCASYSVMEQVFPEHKDSMGATELERTPSKLR